ncbi:nucleotidyltransferase domain-containing protein [Streptomyces vastus]|uniref:Polymerase nucleotidyl transferase domain-containing protein n=1 Tax=Streptomyces vastus TaxID=285451 RepID=A0ABP6E919_9ACTN
MPPNSLAQLVDRLVRTVGEDLPLWIESVSIAGSYARDEHDEHSDLDLFFLIAPGSDATVDHAADILIDWAGDVVLRRGPVLVPHFGYSITAVLADLSVCQMNVNTRETIELNPMRSASRLVLDRNGYMTSLVAQSKSMLIDISKVYHEHYCYFWIRALYAFRSAQRGELWRAIEYLADMRKAMQQIIRIQHGRYSPVVGPYHPAKRYEEQMGADGARILEFSQPAYSRQSILQSILKSVEWFIRETQDTAHFPIEPDMRGSAEKIERVVRGGV